MGNKSASSNNLATNPVSTNKGESDDDKTDTTKEHNPSFLYPVLLTEGFVRLYYFNYLNIPSLIINKITKYIDPKTKIFLVTNDEDKNLKHLEWFQYINDCDSTGYIDNIYPMNSGSSNIIKHFIIHYSNGNLLWYTGRGKSAYSVTMEICLINFYWEYKKYDTLCLSDISCIDVFNLERSKNTNKGTFEYNDETSILYLNNNNKNNMIFFVNIANIKTEHFDGSGLLLNVNMDEIIEHIEVEPYFPKINDNYGYVEPIKIDKMFIFSDSHGIYILCNNGKLFEKQYRFKRNKKVIFNIACYRDIYIIDVICNKYVTFLITKFGEIYYKSTDVNGEKYGLFPDHCSEFIKYEYFHIKSKDNDDDKIKYLKIVSLKLGKMHGIALDENGFVYIWGSNKYGQLTEEKEIKCIDKPKQLQIFEKGYHKYQSNLIDINWNNDIDKNDMIKFEKIVLGNNHSFIMNIQNKICYGFGDNTYQQLSLYNADTSDVKNSTICNAIIATKMNVFEKLMTYNKKANIFAIKDETYVVVEQ